MAAKSSAPKKAHREQENSAEGLPGRKRISRQPPKLKGPGGAFNGKHSSKKQVEKSPDHERVRDLCERLGYPVVGRSPDWRLYIAVSDILQGEVTEDDLKQMPQIDQLYKLADHFLYNVDGVGLWRKHRLTHGLQGEVYFLNWPEHRDR